MGSICENIKWLFFDLGSTLVDETDCYEKRYAETVEHTDISSGDLKEKAIEFYRQNKKGDLEAAKYYGLTLAKWHTELEHLYPKVRTVLKALNDKGYHLGIIANQLPGTRDRLEKWEISEYFEVVMASAEEGMEKPDLKIFEKALMEAGCLPEEAVMIGDRLDNDIVPAKKAGMKTVWLKQGMGGYQEPGRAEEEPDYVIDEVTELKDIFPMK